MYIIDIHNITDKTNTYQNIIDTYIIYTYLYIYTIYALCIYIQYWVNCKTCPPDITIKT